MSTFNGRVNIKSPNTSDLFKMYDKIPAHQCSTFRNPTEGIWNETILSTVYFSSENIQVIQNGIRAGVYKRSNGQYLIGPQDCDTLKVIMRSIFLQYSANKPGNIKEQVAELNKLVLNFCIQQVYSEAQGYINYINDVSTLVIPLSNPIMPDNTDRQLEFKRWF
jgi:hypothetical protein